MEGVVIKELTQFHDQIDEVRYENDPTSFFRLD